MHTRTPLRRRPLLLALALAGLAALLPLAGQATAAVTGTRSVLVILSEWAEKPRDAVTPASAAAVINNEVNAWYREVSDGQLGFTGTATPWVTLPAGTDACGNPGGYRTAAESAARAAGFDPAGYQHVVLYSTQTGCLNSATLNGTHLWIYGGSLAMRVVAHELGHTIGLRHSDVVVCTNAQGARVTFKASGCLSVAQGDGLDMMGTSSGHFNAMNQDQLGWLVGARKKTVGVGSTTSTIRNLEKTTDVLQAVKVTTGGRDYWIEYRQATGADAFLSAWPGATNGVVVHTNGGHTAPYYGTWLLDMTPAESSVQAALGWGKSWTDPSGKLTIKAVGKVTNGAKVTVTLRS